VSQILPGLDLSSYSHILQGLKAVIVSTGSETPINCLEREKTCSILKIFEGLDSSEITM